MQYIFTTGIFTCIYFYMKTGKNVITAMEASKILGVARPTICKIELEGFLTYIPRKITTTITGGGYFPDEVKALLSNKEYLARRCPQRTAIKNKKKA